MSLSQSTTDTVPDEEEVWFDDKFRLLAQGKSELEVDFDGIHFDE